MEGRRHYPVTNFETPYWSPGLPTKPVSTVRPQSAMGFTSNSSYNHGKAFPERPPTSLGVVLGSSIKTTAVNQAAEARLAFPEQSSTTRHWAEAKSSGYRIYDDYSCLVPPTHQRSQSYGDGVTLGEGHNDKSFIGDKSEDVYATVARRQVQSKTADNTPGYAISPPFEQRQQSQVKGKQAVMSGQTRGSQQVEHNTGQNLGRDNPAFVTEERAHISGEIIKRPASTSLDLRSAWQRLYGNSPDMPAPSRRPSAGDILSPPKTRMLEDSVRRQYTRQQNSNIPSPRFAHSQIVKHDPHELVQNISGPVISSGHDSSQDGGYTPHYGSASQHSQLITIRESPTGQSSSNPDHTSGSNASSQFSSYSISNNNVTTFKAQKKKPDSNLDPAIGPASKYPETQRGNMASVQSPVGACSQHRNHRESDNNRAGSRQNVSSPSFASRQTSPVRQQQNVSSPNFVSRQTSPVRQQQNLTSPNFVSRQTSPVRQQQNLTSPNFVSRQTSPVRQQHSSTSDVPEFNVLDNQTHPTLRFSSAFLYSDNSFEEEYSLKQQDSVFDYPEDSNENDSDPPPVSHSPRAAVRRSGSGITQPGNTLPANISPRFSHKNMTTIPLMESLPKTPDLLRSPSVGGSRVRATNNEAGGATVQRTERKIRSHLGIPGKEDQRPRGEKDVKKDPSHNISTNYVRSRSLDDLRESEIESVLSFDIENTILTVEPSDQSEMGTVCSYKGSNSVKAQLKRLEGMYTHVMSTLEDSSHGTHTRRRWSIGSSETSSLRHHTHQSRHSRMSVHRFGNKDVRVIGKRFQRLESHVITLARSVAHLSSELRAQNSLSREIENVKREIHELKTQSPALPAASGNPVRGNRLLSEFERYQGWVPSLTNPRRVNKLTKFFGQEPPLLEIFLKQLGYEKFLRNFEEEHIGMIELPYMTEERLQSIGIPMGPRLRILQEAQLQFKQGNFDIYFI